MNFGNRGMGNIVRYVTCVPNDMPIRCFVVMRRYYEYEDIFPFAHIFRGSESQRGNETIQYFKNIVNC